MPGLDPGIFTGAEPVAIAGSSPAMMVGGVDEALVPQCTLIGISSCSKALPKAASFEPEMDTGVPSAL